MLPVGQQKRLLSTLTHFLFPNLNLLKPAKFRTARAKHRPFRFLPPPPSSTTPLLVCRCIVPCSTKQTNHGSFIAWRRVKSRRNAIKEEFAENGIIRRKSTNNTRAEAESILSSRKFSSGLNVRIALRRREREGGGGNRMTNYVSKKKVWVYAFAAICTVYSFVFNESQLCR